MFHPELHWQLLRNAAHEFCYFASHKLVSEQLVPPREREQSFPSNNAGPARSGDGVGQDVEIPNTTLPLLGGYFPVNKGVAFFNFLFLNLMVIFGTGLRCAGASVLQNAYRGWPP